VAPSTRSYNALLAACDRGGQPARALEVLRRMHREALGARRPARRLLAWTPAGAGAPGRRAPAAPGGRAPRRACMRVRTGLRQRGCLIECSRHMRAYPHACPQTSRAA